MWKKLSLLKCKSSWIDDHVRFNLSELFNRKVACLPIHRLRTLLRCLCMNDWTPNWFKMFQISRRLFPATSASSRFARPLSAIPGLGQPHPTTHPHLFAAADQVNPGITQDEFRARRTSLAEAVLRYYRGTQTARRKLRSYGLNASPDEPNSHLVVVPSGIYDIESVILFL